MANLVIVHGVQSGDNNTAVEGPKILGNNIDGNHNVLTPAYEDISDDLKGPSGLAIELLGNIISPVVGKLLGITHDALVDLEVYQTGIGKRKIKSIVRESIKNSENCILIGHSLGSVICFDIISDLMREGAFNNKDTSQWPVRCFVSLGSILTTRKYYERRKKLPSHNGSDTFNWHNLYDLNDPFVRPDAFDEEDYYAADAEEGVDEHNPYAHIDEKSLANSIYKQSDKWNVNDITVKVSDNDGLTGTKHHTSYWKDQDVIDYISKLT